MIRQPGAQIASRPTRPTSTTSHWKNCRALMIGEGEKTVDRMPVVKMMRTPSA
ncbi:hypothetical protein D9M70_600340 [compost metagenome]